MRKIGRKIDYKIVPITKSEMKTKTTNDLLIREKLRTTLLSDLRREQVDTGHPVRIFSEFNINHGTVRADIVTINGVMHGYEIKSDVDTLERLPEQVAMYSKVFDKSTLVVGERYIIESLAIIPDWWGVELAKIVDGGVILSTIREADFSPVQDKMLIARLLWRSEAIDILESLGKDDGVRTKKRALIYERLISVLGEKELKNLVKDKIFKRANWRFDQSLLLCDD